MNLSLNFGFLKTMNLNFEFTKAMNLNLNLKFKNLKSYTPKRGKTSLKIFRPPDPV